MARKLSLGNFNAEMPKNWTAPSPLFNFKTGEYDTDGLVWYGRGKAGPKALRDIREKFGPNVRLDKRSLVGMKHEDYSTFRHVHLRKEPYIQHHVF